MKKERIGGLVFNTPATGKTPVLLHEQKATTKDLGPKASKRRKRRKGK